jgi:hypothetical protein
MGMNANMQQGMGMPMGGMQQGGMGGMQWKWKDLNIAK